MGMSRRNFIKTFAVLAAGSAMGCAAKKPVTPEIQIEPSPVDSLIPPETPDHIKRYACIVRMIKNEQGEDVVEGYTLPPLVYKEGEPAKRKEIILAKQVPLEKLAETQIINQTFETIEEARAYKKLLDDVAAKTQAELDKQNNNKMPSREVSILLNEDDIKAFNEKITRIQERTVFDTRFMKPRAKGNNY